MDRGGMVGMDWKDQKEGRKDGGWGKQGILNAGMDKEWTDQWMETSQDQMEHRPGLTIIRRGWKPARQKPAGLTLLAEAAPKQWSVFRPRTGCRVVRRRLRRDDLMLTLPQDYASGDRPGDHRRAPPRRVRLMSPFANGARGTAVAKSHQLRYIRRSGPIELCPGEGFSPPGRQ